MKLLEPVGLLNNGTAMNKTELNKLKELALKGLLDEKSKARLSQLLNSEELAQIEQDIALSKLLQKLPSYPVSSNFTARVMETIQTKEPELVNIPFLRLIWQNLTGKLVPVSLLIISIAIGYISYNEARKTKLAGSIIELERVAMLDGKNSGLSVEVFKDFDVIQKMNLAGSSSMVDLELLTALKNQ